MACPARATGADAGGATVVGAAAFRGEGGGFGAAASPRGVGTAPAGGGWFGCWPPGTAVGAGPAAIPGGRGTTLGAGAVPVISGAAGLSGAGAGAFRAVATGGDWLGGTTVSRGAAGTV